MSLAWEDKKALCIFGAGQIGKTTVVRQFAQQAYKCFVELDFVVRNGTRIDLLEIKSGNDSHAHPALDKVRKVEGCNICPGIWSYS